MGKLSTFEIVLDNAKGVYYPGQNVEGHCNIVLNREMQMRGIRLEFEGKAIVEWTHSKTVEYEKRYVEETWRYYSEEEYFKKDFLQYGADPDEGTSITNLPAGHYTYPFSFALPADLPSSFEGEHGHVRYSVKGVIDRPWKFDHICQRPFTVIGLLDLNADANAQIPVREEDEKTICCLCCASGPISVDFSLERRGYVPGEPINLFANIRNHSSGKIDSSSIELMMFTTYHIKWKKKMQEGVENPAFSLSKEKQESKQIGKLTEGPVEAGECFSWEGQQFVLPPLPPSRMVGCDIIDIKYVLQLKVESSECVSDFELPLEIIIGTIPLHHVMRQHPPPPARCESLPKAGYDFNRFQEPPQGATAPFLDMEDSAISLKPIMPVVPYSDFPELPPPSYSECMFTKGNSTDKEDNAYTGGNVQFAPVYTYYDWGRQPTTTSDMEKQTSI